jgi:D-3-phosphoglycerate dehydrogenase
MPASRTVLVSTPNFDGGAVAYLEGRGCRVEVPELGPGQADGELSHDRLLELAAGADGWIAGQARITGSLIAALPRLKVISRRGVGYERVDVEAARDLGRVVAIAVGGNDSAVADQVIGMMIALGRRFRELQANMVAGNWSILAGGDLYRKTVGIVGLGRIGRGVVQRLAGFEARILATAPRRDEEYAARHGIAYVDLPALLAQSDFVTIHAPLNERTRFMINRETIALMKPGAVVINTGRGGLVEDAHLLEALKAGRLGGAGLDVFVSEADPAYAPVSQELAALPNVVATPHVGGSSRESLARTNMIAAESVVAVLDGGAPPPERTVVDGRR